MPVLITGGAGFIGNCLTRQFIEHTCEKLVVLDKLTYAGNLDALSSIQDNNRLFFVHGDICDVELTSKILKDHSPTAVINLAAESHVDRSISGPAEFIQTNVVGTSNLLHACYEYWNKQDEEYQNNFRFLHISTDEVYGSANDRCSETTQYKPNSPYAASKAASNHIVRAYNKTYGLPTLTTNCSNNYGPYQYPEKLIPLMICKALNGEPLPIYGDGQNVRDWIHVGDHCNALRLVLNEGKIGETYNIGGNNQRTNLQMVHTICDVVDKLTLPKRPSSDLITFVNDRPGHDKQYSLDCSRIINDLGWRTEYKFETGIEQTVRWYYNNN